jgi:small-conductance mechanosensitive channel
MLDFADSGIQLELRIWISDPENGIGNVRTEVNLAIWRLFKTAGITIPYPQRDLHLKAVPALRTVVEDATAAAEDPD